MSKVDMTISPLGRVEGDLDLRVTIENNVVTEAWTTASMFRGFEIILKGKDPQAGLIMTPRICGICGGSHLYKACYALDTAFATEVPPNATLIRNIAQGCETLQSIPRYYYALFAIDFCNKNYAKSKLYAEAVKRYAPVVGTSYEPGVTYSGKPVEVYAILGGQWPHSSFMVPGGVMGAPTLSDITRSTAILQFWKDAWLEKQWLGCSIERWMQNKTWEDVLAWVDENESQYNSDCGFFIRYCLETGLDKYGSGYGNFLATGTYLDAELYQHPTIEGRNDALQLRSGIYCDGEFYDFDQANVREDHTHSYFRGTGALHPFEGVTDPIDPKEGPKQDKYTWAKAPRYLIPGKPLQPLETGPLARQVICGRPGAKPHQDYDPLMLDIVKKKGTNIMTRVLARMHEAPKLFVSVMKWMAAVNLHEKFYIKPKQMENGKGFGSTEAARGSLSDWVIIKDGKIENYQVVTPTAWNIGPKDGKNANGPMEQCFIGSPIADMDDPVEVGHVARSFDSCLVCTVHAYDGKTGRKLAQYKVNGGAC